MKQLLLVIFILFIILLFPKDDEINAVFSIDADLGYKVFDIKLDNIDINNYIEIFNNINEDDYKILDYKFLHNYNKKLNSEINSIKIKGGNYIDAMNEYIDKYVEILDKYDIESEISKVKNGRILISDIKLYTVDDIYKKIKKMQSSI